MGKRQELKQLGIYYPEGHGKYAQHRLAKITERDTLAKARKAITKLTKRHNLVLLASEFFSELKASDIAELVDSAGSNTSIEVFFSARRLDKVVPSQYQQFVRSGYTKAPGEYFTNLLEEPDTDHETRLFWKRHSYDLIVERWAKALGPSQVHVVFVDELQPEFLMQFFETQLGLPEGLLSGSDKIRLNRSLDSEELALVIALRKELGPTRVESEWAPIFREKFIASMASSASPNPESKKIGLSEALTKNYLRVAGEQESAIRKLGVLTKGQWPSASDEAIISSDLIPSHVYIETVAKAIATIKPKHYLAHASVPRLFAEIRKRIVTKLTSFFSRDTLE